MAAASGMCCRGRLSWLNFEGHMEISQKETKGTGTVSLKWILSGRGMARCCSGCRARWYSVLILWAVGTL